MIDYSHELTPLGAISRLEYCLSRFEVELAEEKRAVREAADRLPGYHKRLGETFAFESELEAKREERNALDASLAKNDEGEAGATDSAA
jgi:hypothetical protein